MKTLAILIAATIGLSLPGVAGAAACKDSHGRFVKCPAAAAAPHAAPAPHAPAAVHANRTVHANTAAHVAAKPHAATAASGQRCRNAKGQFAKCGTPGAHPA